MGRCLTGLVSHPLGGVEWVGISLGWSIIPSGYKCPLKGSGYVGVSLGLSITPRVGGMGPLRDWVGRCLTKLLIISQG